MANKVWLVYEGDAWLSKSSLVVKGVYDDFALVIRDILEEMSMNLMLNGEQTADKVANALAREHQTFGFDTNYMVKSADINDWEGV